MRYDKFKFLSLASLLLLHSLLLMMLCPRYIDSNLNIHQRLVHLGHYEDAFNNRELAGVLTDLLLNTLGVQRADVVLFQADRASCNTAAVSTLHSLFTNSSPGGCMSHTLTHCGEHIKMPSAKALFSALNNLLSRSLAAKVLWRKLTGHAWRNKSKTRWWSEWECLKDLLGKLDHLQTFLTSPKLSESEFAQTAAALWERPESRRAATFELQCVVSVAEPFVAATYQLEGDGALALITFDIVSSLCMTLVTALPNMEFPAVRKLAHKNAVDLHLPPGTRAEVGIVFLCRAGFEFVLAALQVWQSQ